MASNRFQQLLKFIHFADNEIADQQDRLYKLRPLVERLCKNFSDLRIPDEMLATDETMIKFRGRLLFRQYIRGKSSKYGIKLFKICDPDGYTYKAVVGFKFFVSRFHHKSNIFQPVLSQKVIFFLANKLIIFNYFLINISK